MCSIHMLAVMKLFFFCGVFIYMHPFIYTGVQHIREYTTHTNTNVRTDRQIGGYRYGYRFRYRIRYTYTYFLTAYQLFASMLFSCSS